MRCSSAPKREAYGMAVFDAVTWAWAYFYLKMDDQGHDKAEIRLDQR